MANSIQEDALSRYREKRIPGRTPEPFGGGLRAGASIFLVNHHAATQLHYDLRLEIDGALWSWAVPKGPSPDPADKRLALQVEPHPLDYATFEGLIPEGQYGAGASIIWDRGVWVPLKDVEEGLAQGKLLFELRGHKLLGRWTLVKTRGGENHWLLIKERDRWVDERGTGAYPADSILSGLTVEQLPDPGAATARLRHALNKSAPKAAPLAPEAVKPMLCRPGEPFSDPDWLFEVKYDGYRVLGARTPEGPRLISRAGNELGSHFPEILEALWRLPWEHVLIDGELIVPDAGGLPSFERLLLRAKQSRRPGIELAAWAQPAQLMAFDLLNLADRDLRRRPLLERKQRLRELLPSVGPIRYADHVLGQGEALYAQAEKLGIEGLIAKRCDSLYSGERSDDWRKITSPRTLDFAVIGWREEKGGRGVGAIHMALRQGAGWVYAGRAGSGLGEALRGDLETRLERLATSEPVCAVPENKTVDHWLEPQLVAEVRFKALTSRGAAREPVVLRLRDDKPATDCLHPDARETAIAAVAEGGEHAAPALTNLDKVFWPEEGLTKGELIAYYRAIAPWLLPWLKDRPLVLTRYPDGIEGKSFFQRIAPDFVPAWVTSEPLWSESDGRHVRLFRADSEEALLYLVNMGSIPLHIWSSRFASLDRPDYCILDLDPKQAPFAHVIRIARSIHAICRRLDIRAVCKTSGASGLHILIPLAGALDHEQSRQLAEMLARLAVRENPQIATVTRPLDARGGRVYVDYGQNGEGRLLAAAFCVRPLPGAPVSMPVRWSEVRSGLTPRKYTMAKAVRRMRRLGEDPCLAALGPGIEVPDVLARIGPELMDA